MTKSIFIFNLSTWQHDPSMSFLIFLLQKFLSFLFLHLQTSLSISSIIGCTRIHNCVSLKLFILIRLTILSLDRGLHLVSKTSYYVFKSWSLLFNFFKTSVLYFHFSWHLYPDNSMIVPQLWHIKNAASILISATQPIIPEQVLILQAPARSKLTVLPSIAIKWQ